MLMAVLSICCFYVVYRIYKYLVYYMLIFLISLILWWEMKLRICHMSLGESWWYQLFTGVCWGSRSILVCNANISFVFLSRIVLHVTTLYFYFYFLYYPPPCLLISIGSLVSIFDEIDCLMKWSRTWQVEITSPVNFSYNCFVRFLLLVQFQHSNRDGKLSNEGLRHQLIFLIVVLNLVLGYGFVYKTKQ